jgi:hypothetical protein
MYIELSPEAVQTLKSLDRIPDSQAQMSRSIAEELLSFGLAYEARACGVINMTAAGRVWLSQRAAWLAVAGSAHRAKDIGRHRTDVRCWMCEHLI